MDISKSNLKGGSRLVIAALLISVVGFAGCQQRKLVDDSGFGGGVMRLGDTEVARIDATPIYLSDVERAAAAGGLIPEGQPLTTSDPVFLVTLEELIDQRLLALDALRQGMDQEDEARRRLMLARERILGNLRVERLLAEAVNERTVRALYDAQADLANRGEERRARQIVLATQDEAVSAANRLEAGEDFAELVGELSIDEPTARASGEMGWMSRDMMTGALRRAVFDTPIGQRAGPIATPQGYHIIEVLQRRTPRSLPFEDTREDLERFMTFEAIDNLVTGLRDDADIQFIFGQAAIDKGGDAEGGPSAVDISVPGDPDIDEPSEDEE